MKTFITIFLFANLLFSQNFDSPKYYHYYAEAPTLVGGIDSLSMRVVLPDSVSHFCIEGKVYLMAYIDSLGNLDSAKVIKGLGYGIDEAALNAVKLSKFTPGYTHKIIKRNFSGPSKFRLAPVPSLLVIPVFIKPK